MTIDFKVAGNPKAQKRHRHTTTGKFVRTYDPSANDKKLFLEMCGFFAPDEPIEGAIRISLVFVFERPLSHYGTGKNSDVLKDSAPYVHTGKPDLDNLQKFVFDALNGTFFKDDSQIIMVTASKRYVISKEELPLTDIVIFY